MVKTPCLQGLIPGQGTKIPQATWLSVKKKKKKKKTQNPNKTNKISVVLCLAATQSTPREV